MGGDGYRTSSAQLEIELLIIVGLRNLILVNSDLNQETRLDKIFRYQYAVKADMMNRKSGKLQREHCEPFRPPAMLRWKSYILCLLVNLFYYEVNKAVPSQRMPLYCDNFNFIGGDCGATENCKKIFGIKCLVLFCLFVAKIEKRESNLGKFPLVQLATRLVYRYVPIGCCLPRDFRISNFSCYQNFSYWTL